MTYINESSVTLQKLFTLFSVYFFSFFYFYPFNNGFSFAPFKLRILKELVFASVLLVSITKFSSREFIRRLKRHFLLLLFLVTVFITSIINYKMVVHDDYLFGSGKVLLFSMTLFVFEEDLFLYFKKNLGVNILIQFAISLVVFFAGWSLWKDGDFVGSLSNPNCFGLFSNIAFFTYLIEKRINKKNIFILLISLFCVFFSRSLSQQLILILLLMLSLLFFQTRNDRKRIVLGLVSFFVIVVLMFMPDVFSFNILKNVVDVLFQSNNSSGESLSLSVSGRTSNLKDFILILSQSSALQLIFGSLNRAFFFSDCQYFYILVNYGVFGFSLFVAYLFTSFTSVLKIVSSHFLYLCLLLLFLISFLFTRLLDYFPVNFFFFLFLNFVNGSQFAKNYEEVN